MFYFTIKRFISLPEGLCSYLYIYVPTHIYLGQCTSSYVAFGLEYSMPHILFLNIYLLTNYANTDPSYKNSNGNYYNKPCQKVVTQS